MENPYMKDSFVVHTLESSFVYFGFNRRTASFDYLQKQIAVDIALPSEEVLRCFDTAPRC